MMIKTTLGTKIKNIRKIRKLTQTALTGDMITRNMLSRIENGAANPSLETLEYLANGLGVSVSYLLSEDDDLLFYEKKDKISQIYKAYEAKNYAACIKLINSLSDKDNELNYILSASYLEHAKSMVRRGSLITALKNLELCEKHCKLTVIDTQHIEAQIPMYTAIAKNIQSPLLEFDSQKYTSALVDSVDYEFFKYLTLDFSYAFETSIYSLHMEAKKYMKERSYLEASKILLGAAELSKKDNYNAFVIFSIYTDLEYCYKQLYNYEKAYLYSNKRITLLEGFKS
jgi:transcriptional regulator with XRE-family HTH domain